MNFLRLTAPIPALLCGIVPLHHLNAEPAKWKDVVADYCTDCHDGDANKGGLDLESIAAAEVGKHSASWERVVRQLRARQMPPSGKKRPPAADYDAAAAQLEVALDLAADANPNPGRTDTLRRLNRTEYQNAIRDLLALEIDASTLLPADEPSHGFDNVTVSELSPALLERYIAAAQKISRLAVGGARRSPDGRTVRIRPDLTQEEHVDGLPIGTRGGALIRHNFPRDGEYEIRIRLMRDRNEEIEGLRGRHQLEVLLDRERAATFEVAPPPNRNDHTKVDAHLMTRVAVTAGPHDLGVTFPKISASLQETLRQPYQAHFNMHRHPRLSPAVYQVTITGPFEAGEPGETPSRRRLFGAQPVGPGQHDAEAAAKKILATVMRRAYRRPVADADLARPMRLFRQARAEGGFDAGIEAALAAVLVGREFLFRVERDPEGIAPQTPYPISDVDLASRLSFFLWSSIPDDELPDHVHLMFDLQILALQGDVTRVITFQLARETSNRTYPEIGVPDPHHPLSHHGNDRAKIAKMAKINQFHVSLFAEFLQRLAATRDGDGSLLDHSLYLYGSGMGNPNVHDHTNLPILVAGGAAGGMKGGRHIEYNRPRPLANLHLTLLDKVGVRLDKFADSDGLVEELGI